VLNWPFRVEADAPTYELYVGAISATFSRLIAHL
jgi:hypothetical protein